MQTGGESRWQVGKREGGDEEKEREESRQRVGLMCTLKLLVLSFAGQDEYSLVAVAERGLQCGRAQLLVVLEYAFVRVGVATCVL